MREVESGDPAWFPSLVVVVVGPVILGSVWDHLRNGRRWRRILSWILLSEREDHDWSWPEWSEKKGILSLLGAAEDWSSGAWSIPPYPQTPRRCRFRCHHHYRWDSSPGDSLVDSLPRGAPSDGAPEKSWTSAY